MSAIKKVSFQTLGCKLNFSETATIARQFEEGGFTRHDAAEEADICVVNTCSVTEHADKKCRNLIRKIARRNPDAIIAVTGCYAQLKPEVIAAIEGVDIVLGNNEKGELYKRVSELAASGKKGFASVYSCESDELTGFFASFSTTDRTRAFLKVQDGCSYKCSYCTIPYARGESRNIAIKEIVSEAKEIAKKGIKEIVITGINTGDFGRTTGEKFPDLLKALADIEGIERYRISSIEPNLLTDEVISITASERKFMPHFHIPIQSGSDKVLGMMRRRYTTSIFAERIEAVRKTIPDVFFGIDVIVGFPGETEEEFEMTLNFLKQVKPAYLHVFPYSERAGTPAVELPGKVPAHIASKRVQILNELSDQLYRSFTKQYSKTTRPVLWESDIKKGMISGYTDNYIKVYTKFDRDLVNNITPARLTPLDDSSDLYGDPLPSY